MSKHKLLVGVAMGGDKAAARVTGRLPLVDEPLGASGRSDARWTIMIYAKAIARWGDPGGRDGAAGGDLLEYVVNPRDFNRLGPPNFFQSYAQSHSVAGTLHRLLESLIDTLLNPFVARGHTTSTPVDTCAHSPTSVTGSSKMTRFADRSTDGDSIPILTVTFNAYSAACVDDRVPR